MHLILTTIGGGLLAVILLWLVSTFGLLLAFWGFVAIVWLMSLADALLSYVTEDLPRWVRSCWHKLTR